ncbi:MAG: hypothetical protein IJS59_09140, partial [Bacteroidaceae bacterium]|nr:hypothetical protein [Bacteroidaceae bacterium]
MFFQQIQRRAVVLPSVLEVVGGVNCAPAFAQGDVVAEVEVGFAVADFLPCLLATMTPPVFS